MIVYRKPDGTVVFDFWEYTQDEYQRDYREYVEEMSYGGETFDPNEGKRSEVNSKR